jgi:hypothetical protein
MTTKIIERSTLKSVIVSTIFFTLFLGAKIVIAQPNNQVNGTTGTPLGGFGTGAVKFNATNGSFAILTRPPADAYDFAMVKKAKFQIFTQRGDEIVKVDKMTSLVKDGHPDDNAIWPLHKVNFGVINNVQVDMLGFAPLDNENYDNMSLPYAFYEITLTNTSETDVTVAVALQWDAVNDSFNYAKSKGIFSQTRTVFAYSKGSDIEISGGNAEENHFLNTGSCNNIVNSSVGKVAVKLDLDVNESKKIRFVIAWYDNTDPELAQYLNLFGDSKTVADYGLKQFEKLKKNAETLVDRFSNSNLPDWLKHQTLNTLANLSTNSMYKKDGRVGFSEGQWTCFGTMDQMWHARQIVSQLVPFYAWQELRYWARTQMSNGQIHHDFNVMGDDKKREQRSVLVDWDATEHTDYRSVLKWVDLNCAMIVSCYETYQITGDKEQFYFLWPYLKKAGQRILDQVEAYGSEEFPYTFDDSENSYDAGGDPNPFNASISAVAYKIMIILAKEKEEPDLVKRYQEAYDGVVVSFQQRYLNDENFNLGTHSESYYAGQWLAFNLKLGEIWNAEQTDFVLNKLDSYYHPYYLGLGNEKGTYDEWTPYILTHYAGLLLNTNRANQWSAMQKDGYKRQYMNRDLVFDHPLNILPVVIKPKLLATNISSGNQYISMPGLWRNYYDIVGYHRDLRTNELWVTPILPVEVDHKMKDGLFISPEGYGSISCIESGKYFQNKEIEVKTDSTISVSTLYLADDFGENVTVTINKKNYPFERNGTGYSKELAIKWNGTIDKKGIMILVKGDPGKTPPKLPIKPNVTIVSEATGSKTNAFNVIEAESASKSAGVEISRLSQGGDCISSCNNFDYIQFSDVDFGEIGADKFFALVAATQMGSEVEIVLDNVAGEMIGTCSIPLTGSFKSWATVSCSIAKVTGVHDIVLRFSGGSSEDLMHLDKIIFTEKNNQITAPFMK